MGWRRVQTWTTTLFKEAPRSDERVVPSFTFWSPGAEYRALSSASLTVNQHDSISNRPTATDEANWRWVKKGERKSSKQGSGQFAVGELIWPTFFPASASETGSWSSRWKEKRDLILVIWHVWWMKRQCISLLNKTKRAGGVCVPASVCLLFSSEGRATPINSQTVVIRGPVRYHTNWIKPSLTICQYVSSSKPRLSGMARRSKKQRNKSITATLQKRKKKHHLQLFNLRKKPTGSSFSNLKHTITSSFWSDWQFL